jgi:hypothetical protein
MIETARTSETLVNFYQTHDATAQKTAIFVLTAVRISNPTSVELIYNFKFSFNSKEWHFLALNTYICSNS